MPSMESFKKALSIFLRISISAALLIFLFRQVDEKVIIEAVTRSNKALLLLAFGIYSLNYVLCLLRWEMLLKAVKIFLRLKRIIISFAGGVFFSLFLPSTIGGDFIRSIDLAGHTRRPREVIATVLLDRLSGYVGLVLVTIFSAVIGARFIQDRSIYSAIAVISAILICILLMLFNSKLYSVFERFLHPPRNLNRSGDASRVLKIRQYIRDVHQELHYFKHHEDIMVKNVLLSVLIQAISPVTFYIIALSLGIKIKLVYFFIFLPIIGAVTLLPISIGGLGLRDALTVYFFMKVGMAKDVAFAMSLLNFFFIVLYACLGGLLYVFTVHHRRIQHHPPPCI